AAWPSSEKMAKVCRQYQNNPNCFLFGFRLDEIITGCIGIRTMDNGRAEILHISVLPEYRGTGIGSKMISDIIQSFSLHEIYAETDRDAVEFYRKIGFVATSLGDKYPGVERFLCERHL
ncbi:MAG TPA: GNAT family N-acetyltransferase, partial [Bacillales bacterium]|nr:GNAT family N-acetyltransferase [Bacillales bacterium]